MWFIKMAVEILLLFLALTNGVLAGDCEQGDDSSVIKLANCYCKCRSSYRLCIISFFAIKRCKRINLHCTLQLAPVVTN